MDGTGSVDALDLYRNPGPAERLRRYGHGRSTFRGNLKILLTFELSSLQCGLGARRYCPGPCCAACGVHVASHHKELPDMLDLAACANDFVLGNEHRLSVFGRFH